MFSEQEFDAALVSPFVYAKDASDISIVPSCSISSIDATGIIRLVFKKNLHHFNRIAVPKHHELERALTQIVLAEKYDMKPTFVESLEISDESIPSEFDAMLLIGDDAQTRFSAFDTALDIVDEWIDLTELPFVHALWVMWNSRSSERLVNHIQSATRHGTQNLDEVAAIEAVRLFKPVELVRSSYLKYDFSLDEEKLDALSGFFRMAFFHGLRRDVPEINVWSGE